MVRAAHADALKMLARRELSEAQVRDRLARRGHGEAAIDEALAALRESGAVDDRRAAAVIARSEVAGRRRGPRRVRQRLQAAGIPPDVAERALADAFEHVDLDAAIEAALDSRLRGRAASLDRRELARLYRQLTSRGFDGERVLRVLRARRERVE